MLGYFDNDNPFIEVGIAGHLSPDTQPIKVMVDTGFNGHLQIPFAVAFPLGLSLVGIQQMTVADGSTVNQFVCVGSVKIENKEVIVPINIGESCSTLLGTKLLKQAGKGLKIDFVTQKVEIFDILPTVVPADSAIKKIESNKSEVIATQE
jgi:clan AA aspartic protease